jgi:hypothetical protein
MLNYGIEVNAKTIALIITFAGLAMVLNPAISGIAFPFPPLPSLYFQIWEIPLIIAFMLFGFNVALPADLLNAAFLIAVFPGPSQPYYAISAVATFGMMLGIYLASKLVARNVSEDKSVSRAKFVSVSVALAILFRVVFMAVLMFGVLYFDPLGVFPPIPTMYIVATVLPLQAIFNVIMPIYTIPTGYLIAKIVSKNLKVGNKVI